MKNIYMAIILFVICAGLLHASLVAEYHFEGNESIAVDSSGNNNDCTINNASKVAGVQGYALEFNGFDSYLDCGNDSSLNFGTGDFTIMAWIKSPNLTASNGFIVFKEDEDTPVDGGGYALFESGDVNGAVANVEGNNNFYSIFDAYGTSVITDNNWHFIAGVYNSSNLTATIYVDGIPEGTSIGDGSSIDTINDLLIGAAGQDFSYLNGTIDEVRLYNEDLSQTFISEVYQDESPTYIPTYTLDDILPILFDALGTSGTFVVTHLIIIGEILLATFVIIAIVYMTKIAKQFK